MTLVKSLQENPAHPVARPTTANARDDIIQSQERKSAFGGQICQDEGGFLHPILDSMGISLCLSFAKVMV